MASAASVVIVENGTQTYRPSSPNFYKGSETAKFGSDFRSQSLCHIGNLKHSLRAPTICPMSSQISGPVRSTKLREHGGSKIVP